MTDATSPNQGSSWSRWDLHVHSPASHLHHYGAGEDGWAAFIDDLEMLPPDVTVIGINDYLTVEGYARVRETMASGRLGNIRVLLPVVELRIKRFSGQGHWKRVNYHVIFSDEVDPSTIEQEFLSSITSSYSLGDGHEWSGPPLPHRLEELGRLVKATAPDPEAYGSDLQTGVDSFNVDPEVVEEVLSSTAFRGRYVTAIGKAEWDQLTWTPASAAEKRSIVSRAVFLFTACASAETFERSLATLRSNTVHGRLLHCSDAHNLSRTAETCRIGHCMTWVNARPSFDGLLLARHEYEERVFVGEEPPQLRAVREHPTRYIRSVEMRATTTADEAWFDGSPIPLNPGLVAIIGNKGSGKSALTDAIALVGNADVEGHLSFLHATRFRHPLSGRAQTHECCITWQSGDSERKSLAASVDPTKPERVRYLPQNYFERLCSEIGEDAYAEFERQLKNVVFSWLPLDRRLSQPSLDDLINRLAGEWRERHRLRKNALGELNVRIASLERQTQPDAVRDLRNRVAERRRELDAHDQRTPGAMTATAQDSTATATDPELEELATLAATITSLDEKGHEHTTALTELRAKQQTLQDFEQRLANVEYYVDQQLRGADAEASLSSLGVDLEAVLTFTIDRSPLADIARTVESQVDSVTATQTADRATRDEAEVRRSTIVARLDEQRRAERDRQDALARWEQQRADIVGAPDVVDSLRQLEASLEGLDDLARELAALEGAREVLFAEVFNDLAALRESYRELFVPVQSYLEAEPLLSDGLAMRVEAVIREDGFARRFVSLIDRSKRGDFFQVGDDTFDELITGTDFNDNASAWNFVTRVLARIRPVKDGRPTDDVDRQLRGSTRREEVYDLLFGLDYLQPHYALTFNEKELAQLSPGERGAALLIFYLLVDQSHVPILLDQPEENLDNETVSRLLVPAIRAARRRRQVVLVTHNPNLAVYCDADEVVLAELSRVEETRIRYRTGGIEDLEVRQWLVNVLEGTGRAFVKRHDKYAIGPHGELVLRSE